MRPSLLAIAALAMPFLVLLLDSSISSVRGAQQAAIVALATSILAGAFAVAHGARVAGRERGIAMTMGAAAVMLSALLLWKATFPETR